MKRSVLPAVAVLVAFAAGGYVGWAWLPRPSPPTSPTAASPLTSPAEDEPGVFYVAGLSGSREFPLPRQYRLSAAQGVCIAAAPLANGGFTQNAYAGQAVRADTQWELLRVGEGGRRQTIPFDPMDDRPESVIYLQPRDILRLRTGG